MKPNHTLTELLIAHRETVQSKLWYEQANDSNISSSSKGRAWHERILNLERELSSINYWIVAVQEVEMMDRADTLFAEALLRKMDGAFELPSLFEQVKEITKAHDKLVA